MKAWSAVTELGQLATVYLVIGSASLALADGDRFGGLFAVVMGALLGIGVAAHLGWTLRAIQRAKLAPEALVTIGTRFHTLWRRVLPASIPLGAVVVYSGLAIGGSWVVACAWLALGAAMVCEAAWAARVQRRRGLRVLRVDARYFLAH